MNSARWRQDPDLSAWLHESRLDAFSELRIASGDTGAETEALLQRAAAAGIPAVVNLQSFLDELAP